MVNAVLLAGTPINKQHLVYGRNKALNSINNRKVIEYILDALYESNIIGKIFIVGPKLVYVTKTLEEFVNQYSNNKKPKDVKVLHESLAVTDSQRFLENILTGYRNAKDSPNAVLFMPSDIPLARGNHIDEFISDCQAVNSKSENDLYYCFVDNKVANETFYQRIRKGFKTKEGEFRPGNIALVMSDKLGKLSTMAKCFQDSRKLSFFRSKLMLFYHLGVKDTSKMIYKYYTGNVRLKDLEDYVSKRLDTRFKLIKSDYPELEYDIDQENDHENLRRLLESSAYSRKYIRSL